MTMMWRGVLRSRLNLRRMLHVKNTGSVARDHLANERTFLAWARTGMSFVGLGVALDSLQKHGEMTILCSPLSEEQKQTALESSPSTHGINVLMVGVGGMFLMYATRRYFFVQSALKQDLFPINRMGILGVVSGTSILTLGGLSMLFAPMHMKSLISTVTGTSIDAPEDSK
mmetsp:Transcript_32268/g.45016  ORF Transcript_32268/g.45016 Transcript_32268/m.45016 type:complete len:171 (-) Transcript_32268:64-576(-)